MLHISKKTHTLHIVMHMFAWDLSLLTNTKWRKEFNKMVASSSKGILGEMLFYLLRLFRK